MATFEYFTVVIGVINDGDETGDRVEVFAAMRDFLMGLEPFEDDNGMSWAVHMIKEES